MSLCVEKEADDHRKKSIGSMTMAAECSLEEESPVPVFISPSPCDLGKFLNPDFSQVTIIS